MTNQRPTMQGSQLVYGDLTILQARPQELAVPLDDRLTITVDTDYEGITPNGTPSDVQTILWPAIALVVHHSVPPQATKEVTELLPTNERLTVLQKLVGVRYHTGSMPSRTIGKASAVFGERPPDRGGTFYISVGAGRSTPIINK